MASKRFAAEHFVVDWLDAGVRVFLVDVERGVRPNEKAIDRMLRLYPEFTTLERREIWLTVCAIADLANKMGLDEAHG